MLQLAKQFLFNALKDPTVRDRCLSDNDVLDEVINKSLLLAYAETLLGAPLVKTTGNIVTAKSSMPEAEPEVPVEPAAPVEPTPVEGKTHKGKMASAAQFKKLRDVMGKASGYKSPLLQALFHPESGAANRKRCPWDAAQRLITEHTGTCAAKQLEELHALLDNGEYDPALGAEWLMKKGYDLADPSKPIPMVVRLELMDLYDSGEFAKFQTEK